MVVIMVNFSPRRNQKQCGTDGQIEAGRREFAMPKPQPEAGA
jgi:hypothetical protein